MVELRHENEVEEDVSHRRGFFRNIRISREEYAKFGLFGAMFFFIGFIYAFMRILKDMFVMKKQDASCFNFIKIFYILPISFGVIIGINYAMQRRSIAKIFNVCLITFASLFSFFGVVTVFEDSLMFDSAPIKEKYEDSNKLLRDFMYTLAEPIATLIYITAELWGSIILSYLFLSYLNEACAERQHSRFIPPLFILTNLSLLTSAIVTTGMMKAKESMDDNQLKIFMGSFFFVEACLTLLILGLKYRLENKVLDMPIFIPKERRAKKPKPKVSFKESLQTMAKSRFLMVICGVVFFYSCLYNLVETVFKFGIKAGAAASNTDRADFSAKFNNIDQYITSIVVITLNFTSFSHLADTKGWTFVAMLTPIVAAMALVCVFGLGAYNSAADDESLPFLNKMVIGNPHIMFENFLGMIIISTMKIFKFTAFDVTKERISMRIEDRYRPKFKSIYDGIFNKLGKSAGSLYGVVINALFNNIDARGFSPVTGGIGAFFVFFWISGIYYLGNSYDESIKHNRPVDIDLKGQEKEKEENSTEAEVDEVKKKEDELAV